MSDRIYAVNADLASVPIERFHDAIQGSPEGLQNVFKCQDRNVTITWLPPEDGNREVDFKATVDRADTVIWHLEHIVRFLTRGRLCPKIENSRTLDLSSAQIRLIKGLQNPGTTVRRCSYLKLFRDPLAVWREQIHAKNSGAYGTELREQYADYFNVGKRSPEPEIRKTEPVAVEGGRSFLRDLPVLWGFVTGRAGFHM